MALQSSDDPKWRGKMARPNELQQLHYTRRSISAQTSYVWQEHDMENYKDYAGDI